LQSGFDPALIWLNSKKFARLRALQGGDANDVCLLIPIKAVVTPTAIVQPYQREGSGRGLRGFQMPDIWTRVRQRLSSQSRGLEKPARRSGYSPALSGLWPHARIQVHRRQDRNER